jgi:hypothetical protein
VAGTGFERTSKSPRKTAISEKGGAESGAVGDDSAPIDPDLAAVIDAWPRLPETVRRDVLRIVHEAVRGPQKARGSETG